MNPKYIIIHHSLTKDSGTVSWQAIRRYHTQHNGWSDIGYHYGIELINDEYEILIGRPLSRNGAHTKGYNGNVGICCVGNFDLIHPSPFMVRKLVQLIKDLMAIYSIPKGNVKGHNEFCDYKTCPGKAFDLSSIRSKL